MGEVDDGPAGEPAIHNAAELALLHGVSGCCNGHRAGSHERDVEEEGRDGAEERERKPHLDGY